MVRDVCRIIFDLGLWAVQPPAELAEDKILVEKTDDVLFAKEYFALNHDQGLTHGPN